jgi:FkbM family methyltransferase
VSRLTKIFSAPAAKAVLLACCAMPTLRPCFARLGMTPSRFASRAARVGIPGGSTNLLLTGMNDNHLSFQLFWRGMDYYEPFTRKVIECLTASSRFFVDVGANIGFFSLVASKLNSQLRAFAFEPNPKMFALLCKHIRLNGLTNLSAESCALSNREGEAPLFLSESDMSASLLPDFQKNFSPALATVPVKLTTLDSFARRTGLSGPVVLKVDVEGHEKEVLEGAAGFIAEFRPDIIIEVLGNFDASSLARLRGHGYHFYRITHQGLSASAIVALTKIGDFTFFNYLFTTRPAGELAGISEVIREHARGINLYDTSKFVQHPV